MQLGKTAVGNQAGCAAWKRWAKSAAIAATAALGIAGPGEARAEDFNAGVKPMLEKFCYKCHGPSKQAGGLRLDSPAAILKGGEGGKVVKPGKADDSSLYLFLKTDDDTLRMPPKGPRPTAAQINAVKAWIDAGAQMPE